MTFDSTQGEKREWEKMQTTEKGRTSFGLDSPMSRSSCSFIISMALLTRGENQVAAGRVTYTVIPDDGGYWRYTRK
jgi:hypothetical protein